MDPVYMRSLVNSLKSDIISPFLFRDRINKILVLLFILVNSIVFFNAVFHYPKAGYDGYSHLEYIRELAVRLPIKGDTREFFSPPLPYFFPSRVYRICHHTEINEEWNGLSIEPCLLLAGKSAQLQNVCLSTFLTFFLLKICGIIRPGNIYFRITSLALLGMLPVYYRTFAFIRGEPFVASLTMFVVYQTLTMVVDKKNCDSLKATKLGITLGLLVLGRQWGMLLFPSIVLFAVMLLITKRRESLPFIRAISTSFVIAFLVGGWFYVFQFMRYGTATTFNRSPASMFSLSNQPLDFYFGIGLEQLFSSPIRPFFPNQFIPIFYSEIWGDYWGYFVVTENNLTTIGHYLGTVNLVSIIPTMILFAGLILGFIYSIKTFHHSSNDGDRRMVMFSFVQLIITVSFAGYLWFLIRYPNLGKGDTIKATYTLHALALLPLLASEFLEGVRYRNKCLYAFLLILVAAVFLHNLPATITHY